jgi:hypothetical protein
LPADDGVSIVAVLNAHFVMVPYGAICKYDTTMSVIKVAGAAVIPRMGDQCLD